VLAEGGTEAERSLGAVLTLLQRLEAGRSQLQALVLTPSEERAQQLALELGEIGEGLDIEAVAVSDGSGAAPEIRRLDAATQILVGAADRLVDHLYRGSFSTDGVRLAVLDGVDQMRELGLLEDAETLCSCLLSVQQYLVVAAVLPQEVQLITDRYMKDPVLVAEREPPQTEPPRPAAAEEPAATPTHKPAPRHLFRSLSAPQKTPFLCQYLRNAQPERAFVFCGTKQSAENVLDRLGQEGFAVGPEPVEPAAAAPIVVTTDAAARGLDLSAATHLINFSVPRSAEVYLQRAETGTAAGSILTLVSPAEKKRFEEIAAETELPWTPASDGASPDDAPIQTDSATLNASDSGGDSELSSEPLPGSRPAPQAQGAQPSDPPLAARQEAAGDAVDGERQEGFERFRRRRRRRRRRRGEDFAGARDAGPPQTQLDAGLAERPAEPVDEEDAAPPLDRDRRGEDFDERQRRRDPGSGRDNGFRRRRTGDGPPRDEFDEPNFNRRGIAPEPPAASSQWNSGMLVGENRDRWRLTDRRGRPVKRPWLSDDDRNQRLFGNQLVPESVERRRRFEELSGRRNGGGPDGGSGRKRFRRRRNKGGFRPEDAPMPDGSGIGRRRHRRRRSRQGGPEGTGPWEG
jgi:superfamily II DNA/RNA helicase